MIQGLLVVGLSGGLVYNGLPPTDPPVNIDRVIAMASTIYTGVEILQEEGVFDPAAKYYTAHFRFARGEMTAFKTETKLMFLVVHRDARDEEVRRYVERVHRQYVEKVLYNPLYRVDGPIPPNAFEHL